MTTTLTTGTPAAQTEPGLLAVDVDTDTTVLLAPGEIAAALHLSGGRVSTVMVDRRTYLTDLVTRGLARAGLAGVRELAATTAELNERIERGTGTSADETRLRRLWRSLQRDEACAVLAHALAGVGPFAGTVHR